MSIRLAAVLTAAMTVIAVAKDSGQWAQIDPAERQWFRNQHNPTTKLNCCNDADGAYAQEDIRDGHYWARFMAKGYYGGDVDSGWMPVPDGAVITDPNRHGSPVVWWYYDQGTLKIRCFASGAKF
jgi:hypothetical protein